MAKEIYVETGNNSKHFLRFAEDHLESASRTLSSMSTYPMYQNPDGGFSPLYPAGIIDEANALRNQINQLEAKIGKYSALIASGPDEFVEIDRRYKNELTNWWGRTTYSVDRFARIHGKTIINEFWDEFGVVGVLAGSNWIKKIYGYGKAIKGASSLDDYYEVGKDIWDFLGDAADTYGRYKQIGRAVGTDKSMWWMFKKVTGLKKVGRVSTAKEIVTRFHNNLTNKTSPFNIKAKFKSFGKELVGKEGTGSAIAAWTRVATTGVSNFFSNKEEMKASGGEMSKDRMIAETVTETAIDLVLEIGAEVVVGAAVSAVLGPVAAPALLVTALSGAAISLTNVAVEHFTGETLTENVSDGILNFAEAIF